MSGQGDTTTRGHQAVDGWFAIGRSSELVGAGVRAAACFGQRLVLYRGTSGTPHVLDAFCRHMGAHLGHGGTVEGEDIRCPFHGWRWGPDGVNVDIPYSAAGPLRVSTRAWPVAEAGGLIWVWPGETAAPGPPVGVAGITGDAAEAIETELSGVPLPHLLRMLLSSPRYGMPREDPAPAASSTTGALVLDIPAGPDPLVPRRIEVVSPGTVLLRGDRLAQILTLTPTVGSTIQLRWLVEPLVDAVCEDLITTALGRAAEEFDLWRHADAAWASLLTEADRVIDRVLAAWLGGHGFDTATPASNGARA